MKVDTGSKVIPAQCVRIGAGTRGQPERLTAPAGEQVKPAEPKITLLKDGNTVTAIEITCTCGAVIRLDCEY